MNKCEQTVSKFGKKSNASTVVKDASNPVPKIVVAKPILLAGQKNDKSETQSLANMNHNTRNLKFNDTKSMASQGILKTNSLTKPAPG